MTDKIKFYTNPMSRGQVARWMLHEVGADYEQVVLDYQSSMKSADYLALNPMGKVPAIVHEGQVVTECAAICAYLADVFPQAGLAPKDNEKAAYFRWLFFAAGPLESAIFNHNVGFAPSPEQERSIGYGTYDLTLNTLSKHLEKNEFICGDRFTAADVYVGAQVDWGVQFQTIPKTEAFTRYAAAMQQRDAYRAAKAIDGELIARQQQDAG